MFYYLLFLSMRVFSTCDILPPFGGSSSTDLISITDLLKIATMFGLRYLFIWQGIVAIVSLYNYFLLLDVNKMININANLLKIATT